MNLGTKHVEVHLAESAYARKGLSQPADADRNGTSLHLGHALHGSGLPIGLKFPLVLFGNENRAWALGNTRELRLVDVTIHRGAFEGHYQRDRRVVGLVVGI